MLHLCLKAYKFNQTTWIELEPGFGKEAFEQAGLKPWLESVAVQDQLCQVSHFQPCGLKSSSNHGLGAFKSVFALNRNIVYSSVQTCRPPVTSRPVVGKFRRPAPRDPSPGKLWSSVGSMGASLLTAARGAGFGSPIVQDMTI